MSISVTALPNRRAHEKSAVEADRQFAKDNEAYRRMRAAGLRPRSVDGAARVEQLADHRFQIESGRMIGAKVKDSRIEEGMAISKEMGFMPKEPAASADPV